jgi:hypothetical protein
VLVEEPVNPGLVRSVSEPFSTQTFDQRLGRWQQSKLGRGHAFAVQFLSRRSCWISLKAFRLKSPVGCSS